MSDFFSFQPPRRRGLLFHAGAIMVLAATSAICFLLGLDQTVGLYIVILLILSLLLFAPLPLILYRGYALLRANYRLERDGLRLRWGLRAEDIPLPDIEWVHRASDLPADLPLPRLVWPGAIRGTVLVRDLGPVEYLASSRDTLLLIATRKRVYAISPEDPDQFLRAFQQAFEMGSLEPISSISVLPVAYLSQIWADRRARYVLLASLLLTLLLFAGAGLVIPGRSLISIGFYPNGQPLPPVPSEQLILLPILGAFCFVTDLAVGLFLYRRENTRLIAFLIWGFAVLTESLFMAAIFQLVQVAG
jgi:hypothetical protein